jgi:hypothetical protein
MKEAMRSELTQFFMSNELKDLFKDAVKSLIAEALEEATLPLQKRIEPLEAELLKVTVKARIVQIKLLTSVKKNSAWHLLGVLLLSIFLYSYLNYYFLLYAKSVFIVC